MARHVTSVFSSCGIQYITCIRGEAIMIYLTEQQGEY